MLNWFRSSANYWMRALPNFSLSTLGQLAGPPAIRWPDCCLSGWPVSTSRATVLHFPKTSDNTVVHPRHDNTFCIDDFDFSFLIQGAGRHDFQWRPLLHWDNLRHGIEQNTGSCPIRRIFVPRQIRYTLYYYVEFRHLTVFALYRMEIYPAQPMSGSPFRQRLRFRNGEQLEISCKTAFCHRHDFEVLAIKANPNLPN